MGAKLCSNNVNEPGLEVKAPTNVFKWDLTQGFKTIRRRLACTFGGGGTGQGQPQGKVPLPTLQLSLWAPQINHRLPRPPEGAVKFPHTSWALPFRIYFWTSMILFFPETVPLGTRIPPWGRREFIAADLSPPAKKPSWCPAAPSHPQDQFCR